VARASHYVHGSDPREQARLELMNRLLNPRHLAAIAPAPGARVLDLGCGTALFALELARAVGADGRVVAVERDPRQLEAARARLAADPAGERVELRAGDAFDPPLAAHEWGSFDLAHARFLLEHVPEPLEVVRALVRAARPGGRVVLADDDHDVLRLHPDVPALEALWRAYVRAYERRGNDPFVGRKLVALLHQAGAAPVRADWLFFGACAGEELFPVVVANLRGILDGARPELAAELPPDRIDAGLAELDRWSRRPDAAFWYPLCWAEGRAPERT
jgi:ubiquinone/menaquinone biosynthesis C-methylase UbiE